MNNEQLPPANIEAEEAILGGILLDPMAMSRVEADVTTPDSHPSDRERASPAHARDFAAPRHLSRQNAPDSPT